MDGGLIVTVISSTVAASGIFVGGFWKVMTRIGQQDKSIGRLDGKIDGLSSNVQSLQGQFAGYDERMGRLDERINGIVNKE